MKLFRILLIFGALSLAMCAPRPSLLGPTYMAYPEIRPIDIELRSYSFHPNHIAVFAHKSPLTLRLTNTADRKHNFTLIDQQKKVIVSIDLKPKESIITTLPTFARGNYTFYCNRFLHRLGGMEGMLMVTE
jgi:plastocyanin